jgi:hypothetical protein
VDTVDFTPTIGEEGKHTYAFTAESSYGAVVQESMYMKGVPRGIFSKIYP